MFFHEHLSTSEQTLNSQNHPCAIYEGYHETTMKANKTNNPVVQCISNNIELYMVSESGSAELAIEGNCKTATRQDYK